MEETQTPLTNFLLSAGGAAAGGATLGGLAGFVAWLLTRPVVELVRSIVRRPVESDFSVPSLGDYLGVTASIGGLAGFVVWLYESVRLF